MGRPRKEYNTNANRSIDLRRPSPYIYGPTNLRISLIILFYLLLSSFLVFSYFGEEKPIQHDLQLEEPLDGCSDGYISTSFLVRPGTHGLLTVVKAIDGGNFNVTTSSGRSNVGWPGFSNLGILNLTHPLEFDFNATYIALLGINYLSPSTHHTQDRLCRFYQNAFSIVLTHPPGSFHSALYFTPLLLLIGVIGVITTLLLKDDFQYIYRKLRVKLGLVLEISDNKFEKIDLLVDKSKEDR